MAVVLITGCSSGIGKVSALAFVRDGYHVFTGARNPYDCAALTNIAGHENLALEVVQLDVTDTQAINAAVN
jgi:NAD(P)-dependent dehydrogenase (short-subunit alcohol dehydrogenase family)